MRTPVNPITATWNWLAYQSSRFATVSFLITSVGGISSGFILSLYSESGWFIVVGLFVAVVTAIPSAGTVYWERKNEEAEDVGAARERVMDEAIPPLLDKARLLSTTPRMQRQQALDLAAETVTNNLYSAFRSVTGIRAVVYKVSDDGTQMVPIARAGRSQLPQPFVKGTRRGDYAFESLKMAEYFAFIDDIEEAPHTWGGSGKGYSTYISAPIRGKDVGYGMLTLDAPKVGDLDSRDGSTVSLLAATLSLFFHEAQRTSRNIK